MTEIKWGLQNLVNIVSVSCHLNRLLPEALVLEHEHFIIISLLGKKLVMGAHFLYLAVFKDYYLVSVLS